MCRRLELEVKSRAALEDEACRAAIESAPLVPGMSRETLAASIMSQHAGHWPGAKLGTDVGPSPEELPELVPQYMRDDVQYYVRYNLHLQVGVAGCGQDSMMLTTVRRL